MLKKIELKLPRSGFVHLASITGITTVLSITDIMISEWQFMRIIAFFTLNETNIFILSTRYSLFFDIWFFLK